MCHLDSTQTDGHCCCMFTMVDSCVRFKEIPISVFEIPFFFMVFEIPIERNTHFFCESQNYTRSILRIKRKANTTRSKKKKQQQPLTSSIYPYCLAHANLFSDTCEKMVDDAFSSWCRQSSCYLMFVSAGSVAMSHMPIRMIEDVLRGRTKLIALTVSLGLLSGWKNKGRGILPLFARPRDAEAP